MRVRGRLNPEERILYNREGYCTLGLATAHTQLPNMTFLIQNTHTSCEHQVQRVAESCRKLQKAAASCRKLQKAAAKLPQEVAAGCRTFSKLQVLAESII